MFYEGVLVCDFGQLSCSIIELATTGKVAPYCRTYYGPWHFYLEASFVSGEGEECRRRVW